MPADWPGGVRREGGASPVCGSCTERGKAGADTVVAPRRVGERERVERRKPETLSTDAVPAGGPARSSGEAPVMGVERRGRLIWWLFEQPGHAWEETSGQVRSGRQAV